MSADHCLACGAGLPAGARFCPQCGRPTAAAPVAIDVEGVGVGDGGNRSTVEPAPASRRGLVIGIAGVAAALLAGVLLLGPDDDDAPDAVPPTTAPSTSSPLPTSTTSGADTLTEPWADPDVELDTIAALDWEAGPDLDRFLVIDIVEFDGAIWVFAAEPLDTRSYLRTGAAAWRYLDGEWEQLGIVLDVGTLVTAVVATDDGFIAIGTAADGAPAIWRSADGQAWDEERIVDPAKPHEPFDVPSEVAVIGDDIVVTIEPSELLALRTIADAITSATTIDPSQWLLDVSPDDRSRVIVRGPLGLHVTSFALDELPLTEPQIAEITTSANGGPSATTVWTRGDGVWSATTLSGPLELLAVDREFVLNGFTIDGLTTYASSGDGEWTPIDALGAPEGLAQWGERLAVTIPATGSPSLRLRSSAGMWTELDLEPVLPDGRNRYGNRVRASDNAIALHVGYFEDGNAFPQPAVLVKDGFTVEMRNNTFVSVNDGVGQRNLLSTFDPPSAGYRPDFAAETVTFLDGDTGEDLVVFTFDELRAYERAAFAAEPDRSPQLIAVSRDAVDWSINWIRAFAGTDTFVGETAVIDDRVITVIGRRDVRPSAAEYQVFVGEIEP